MGADALALHNKTNMLGSAFLHVNLLRQLYFVLGQVS
jgi:hypothetical protein